MEGLGSVIAKLQETCNQMRSSITLARHQYSPVLEEAQAPLIQRHEASKKERLLTAFRSHFVISERDNKELTSSDTNIEAPFFSALEKVKAIYADCRILLGSENQRLGLELMDQCSRVTSLAYQKLYRWIQAQLRVIDFENPQINTMVRRALKTLAERPSLFQSCLEVFSGARDHALSDAFCMALTGSEGSHKDYQASKPIELNSHDPVRHVGDMLAWSHSAAVTEKETLESFFISENDEISKGLQAAQATEPWLVGEESFDAHEVTIDLVGRNLAGVLRMLRQECEQIIRNQDAPAVVYQLVNVFGFYCTIFAKLLDRSSTIVSVPRTLEISSLRMFEDLVDNYYTSLGVGVGTKDVTAAEYHTIPVKCTVPEVLREGLSQLGELWNAYDSPMTPETIRAMTVPRFLEITFRPLPDICENMASAAEEPAKSIFLLNCFDECKRKIDSFNNDAARDASKLAERMACYTSKLVDYQYNDFLNRSGLDPLLAALTSIAGQYGANLERVAALPTFQPEELQKAAETLDEFLPSAILEANERLEQLMNKNIVTDITAEAAERFCDDFDQIEGILTDIDDAQQSTSSTHSHSLGDLAVDRTMLRSYLPRSSAEIRVLLSL